ncbi:MAG: hypothetical protein AUH84_07340 [Thaumarchaeota archaeon 13_1_40CM_4_38_7]|nr:MAG: hypothetical protein AUH84_07340 [Thaumarchaeota archaeon 13_1_40CM_4_38_7]OLC93253.1 MAG: hypothetical protein AUI92_03285 [Thaumarchaeota archaeon 13_1_40CM_3_38_6]
MRTQTEELLWIASQEDHLIPTSLIQFATSKRIGLRELLEDCKPNDFQGISFDDLSKFLKNRESINVRKYQIIWDTVQKERINLITYDDLMFPSQLKELQSNHTVMLYQKGEPVEYKNCIAVVGTRDCSTRAAEIARELGMRLAKQNYVIVAGLARGIDASAHRGAIAAGGKTIAVLPWIHNPYPKEHAKLLEEITQNGCVISENFSAHKKLDKFKFIERNAIISAISDVLVAVESSTSGGTVWQVEIAVEQGRPVIAIEPERENKDAYKGFEKFVDSGAIPVRSVKDALATIKKIKDIQGKSEETIPEKPNAKKLSDYA